MSSSEDSPPRPVDTLIAGGGLCGCLLAVYLGLRGHSVEVHELRPDPRRVTLAAGRSINLALSARGLSALRAVGLHDEIAAAGIPMYGRLLHARDGTLTYVPYGQDGQAIISISRALLNERLMSAAERVPGVRLVFESRIRRIDFRTNTVTLEHAGTRPPKPATAAAGAATTASDVGAPSALPVAAVPSPVSRVHAGVVFGTDGAYSAVRSAMQQTPGFSFAQEYLDHSYKELTIPPTAAGEFALSDPNSLHIWPRGDYMLIALPNQDRSWTLTLFMPRARFTQLDTAGVPAARAFFADNFADALRVMPTFDHDWATNATSHLIMVHCDPWNFDSKALLLGDAAHATVPFFGQGMNASLQDVEVFAQHLDRCQGDMVRAISAFTEAHQRNGDALIQLSRENYVEMRYKVATLRFQLRKKLELLLNRLAPRWFVPRYSMVSFDTVPYAEVVRLSAVQDRVVNALVGGVAAAALVGVVLAVLGVRRGALPLPLAFRK